MIVTAKSGKKAVQQAVQLAGLQQRKSVQHVFDVLLLTVDPYPESVLPALSLLGHSVRYAPPEMSSLLKADRLDVALVDARTHLVLARGL